MSIFNIYLKTLHFLENIKKKHKAPKKHLIDILVSFIIVLDEEEVEEKSPNNDGFDTFEQKKNIYIILQRSVHNFANNTKKTHQIALVE